MQVQKQVFCPADLYIDYIRFNSASESYSIEIEKNIVNLNTDLKCATVSRSANACSSANKNGKCKKPVLRYTTKT